MAQAKKTKAKRDAKRAEPNGDRTVASNRRARHDYDILESTECGIVLVGSEVKSLREGKAQLADAYARIDDRELWLFGLHIPQWKFASGFGGHDSDRKRKLLVHRHQIEAFIVKTQTQPLTLIPLKIYFVTKNATPIEQTASSFASPQPERNSVVNDSRLATTSSVV